MISDKQQAWLNHLSDTDRVEIIPYNPQVKEVFAAQRAVLQSILGAGALVLHKGATAWGLSGKGDVDIYLPVTLDQFDQSFERLRPALGEPGSHYPHERVRWSKQVEGIPVEILLVNQDAEFYRDNLAFWHYIETHPAALAAYQAIKESAAGMSTREYYTRKTIFINTSLHL